MLEWSTMILPKVFTHVLRRFMTKFALLARVYRCASCNRDETGKMRVDTPESGHTVCLIFGRDKLNMIPRKLCPNWMDFHLEQIFEKYPL